MIKSIDFDSIKDLPEKNNPKPVKHFVKFNSIDARCGCEILTYKDTFFNRHLTIQPLSFIVAYTPKLGPYSILRCRFLKKWLKEEKWYEINEDLSRKLVCEKDGDMIPFYLIKEAIK